MPIYALGSLVPQIDASAFVHPDATVIGDVRIGAGSSIWPAAVLRGDTGHIEIGQRTSIQDGTVVHTTEDWPTVIGSDCVVGHNAHLEGCRVGDGCLVGSGSVVLNRAVLEPGSGAAAAALVSEGIVVGTGQIAVGVPARPRPAPELARWVVEAVQHYLDLAERFRSGLRRID